MISGYKDKSLLHFEREGRRIEFDLRDLKFYRRLKNGERREVEKAQGFFRKISVEDIAQNFREEPYAKLIRLVDSANYRKTNFASVFASLKKYAHLESHLVLGIDFVGTDSFNKPANIYSKSVLQFMIESRIQFASGWEQGYLKHTELVTNLCNHVRQNHYLDLEVYRMLYGLITNKDVWQKFCLLIAPGDKTLKDISPDEYYWYGRDISPDEYYWYGRDLEKGYNCEYKTLFDYIVTLDRTEAVRTRESVTLYNDYLRMSRNIERTKSINRIVQKYPGEFTHEEIEILIEDGGYHRVTKYPKNLKLRHDIVARNYRAYELEYDPVFFAKAVDKSLAYTYGLYKMIVPETPSDVKNEGSTLNHCVASYISKIMDGTTQIVFMRSDPQESLVTVEIRAGSIIQARGAGNRGVTNEERAWLEMYAKNKNLNYGKVKRDEKRAVKEQAVKDAEEAIKIADNAEAITEEIMAAVA